jgi:hypothetical protein
MKPQEITDFPVPLLLGGTTNQTGNTTVTVNVISPDTIPNPPPPSPVIAVATISDSLDTSTREIKGAYTFAQMGSLVIGAFVLNESGSVSISPDGITAMNAKGENTFTLDGKDGSAVFKGEVQTGSIVTGLVTVGNNNVIIDGENQRIIINDGSNNRVLIGYQKNGF